MSFDDKPTQGHQTTTAGDGAAADGATGDPAPRKPDAIRAEIERTRIDLSRDVNALGEAVSPGSIAKRQTSKAGTKLKGALTQAKERVMGSAQDPQASASNAGSGSTDASPGMWDRTSEVAQAALRRTQGNPLAVGLIALGAGWLLGRFYRSPRRGRSRPR